MANRNSEVPSSEGERGRYISITTPKGVYLHHTIKDKGKNSAIGEKHCTTMYNFTSRSRNMCRWMWKNPFKTPNNYSWDVCSVPKLSKILSYLNSPQKHLKLLHLNCEEGEGADEIKLPFVKSFFPLWHFIEMELSKVSSHDLTLALKNSILHTWRSKNFSHFQTVQALIQTSHQA